MKLNKENILLFLKQIKPSFEDSGIKKIGLFGSFAKEENILVSDIDIIFKFKNSFLEKCDPWEYFNILNKLKDTIKNEFHMSVDLFDEDSSSSFKENIIKDSIYV